MKNKKAFTLAEMMVVLLVLSLAVAAFMPIMTKRSKSSSSSNGNNIWQYVSDSDKDIYTSEGGTLGAIIGADSSSIGDSFRLLINTQNADQTNILMKENGNKTGVLITDSNTNTALGDVSFLSQAVGGQTLFGNGARSTGMGSTAIGKGARSGKLGVAIGNGAIAGDVDGGYSAFGVSVGTYAALNNTTGTGNTAIGGKALMSNTTGANNTGIGNLACNNVTGSNKACLGANSGPASSSTYATDDEEHIFIGSKSKFNNEPALLEVHNTSGGGTANTDSSRNAKTPTVVVNGNLVVKGNTYITTKKYGSSGPYQSYTLEYDDASGAPGGHQINSGCGNGGPAGYDGSCTGTVVYSDRRLKTNLNENKFGLEQVRKLKTYNYVFKKDKQKKPQVGVMAQDLQKVFPHAVTKGSDGYLMIRQEDMFYAMVNSIKQLDVITQGLVKDFKSLVARIQTIDDRIIALIKVDQINGKKIKELELKNKLLEQQNSTIQKQNKAFELRLNKLEKRIK